MRFANLILDTEQSVATLTLNRPERLSALSADLLGELIDAAEEIGNSDVRAVVIGGAGRAFCAGVDIETFVALIENPDLKARHKAFRLGGAMADAIEAIPQVTVAALHGFVVGGGLVLASACDLRVASADTTFSIPEIDLGIPLGWGGIERLIREIGPARTKEYVMTGRRFTAEEAMSAGFLNEIVDLNDVQAAAHTLARLIASKPRVPIEITKEHIAEVLVGNLSRDDNLSAVEKFDDPESIVLRQSYLHEFRRSTQRPNHGTPRNS
jgi:enoyl-CoA hydratase/carnithine racemase